ncbi:hypothetical protein QA601_10555 [Chitinispirillales bacterium ANBcel5]|uniref:hypothetical protein n=1 Tax=Cellulosispirillum alkaliphilum TaxID=3039283 RepID=UPI002A52D6F8|nr:hypothetical protein [Chitinispirillales bacterium ANBcel5]
MYTRNLLNAVFVVVLAVFSVHGSISVRVYSREDALHENNVSRPRIYIENSGTEPIADFYYYYFFKPEGGVPVFQEYYAPDCIITMHDTINGIYFLKYDFSGLTLGPGEIHPNTDGNSVGLMYDDWAEWNKTNDPSNTRSDYFTLNGAISVFLSDGTQIYGNGIEDPENPPQPPVINLSQGNYAVYSKEFTDIRDRSTIRGGRVGSAFYTEAGAGTEIFGGIYSGGNVFIRERANIEGDVAAVQSINKQNGVVVSGEQRQYAQITFPPIPEIEVEYSGADVSVGPGETATLDPGQYRTIQIFSNATVTLSSGTYSAKNFIVEPDVNIIVEVEDEGKVEIHVSDQISIGDRFEMALDTSLSPYYVSFFSGQSGQLRIGTDALLYGDIKAPNADIYLSSRTTLYGSIAGKKVVVEPDAIVCTPPVLFDFYHNRWAQAPSFDPTVFRYKTVFPESETYIIPKVDYLPGVTVTVNGGEPGLPIDLTGDTTDIVVNLENDVGCGSSQYILSVIRSPNHQLFVNVNSPAPESEQDGESWETAFADLQPAIDKAVTEGRELWVAIGVYNPTYRTDPDDPRSATFMMYPGLRIIASFLGTETSLPPRGDASNPTVLSGDLEGNDDLVSQWPPAPGDSIYLNDNAYNVVTMEGPSYGSKAIRVERVVITGGVAQGGGEKSTGAAIMSRNSTPSIYDVYIERNIADSSGGAIASRAGFSLLERGEVRYNIAKSGRGGAVYSFGATSLIKEVNFSYNRALDSSETAGGGALAIHNTDLTIENVNFIANRASGKGGVVYSVESDLFMTGSSFFDNRAVIFAQGIWHENSTATLENSQIFSDREREIFGGGGFDIKDCVDFFGL